MDAVIEITNTGENWKQWPNAKITVILKSTVDPPVSGTFTTKPDGSLSSANPADYYRWTWDSNAKKVYLMEKWPGQTDVILVVLSVASVPFKSGAVGSGTLIAPNKTRKDQPLSWKYKENRFKAYVNLSLTTHSMK